MNILFVYFWVVLVCSLVGFSNRPLFLQPLPLPLTKLKQLPFPLFPAYFFTFCGAGKFGVQVLLAR